MSSEGYHEPIELFSERTKNLHRGIVSLIEELEAIDWYQQRAEACSDDELRAVILHHRNEEVEHALMNLEWLRRNEPIFDKNARIYLFSEGPITEVEARAEARTAGATGVQARASHGNGNGSLNVGSLRKR
jgi:ferritin-like protein